MSDKEYILNAFKNNFQEFKKLPMALYGIGRNTQLILDNIVGFNIVGLMDDIHQGEKIMGLRVLNNEEVIKKVKVIVIIARLSVVSIIYNRIAHLSKDHHILIYDINKNIPQTELEPNEETFDYWKVAVSQLTAAIDRHDIISFDIYDTLIMRKILFPDHVFNLIQQSSSDKDFKLRRIQAEQDYRNENCYDGTIDDIYIRAKLPSDLKFLEEKIEYDIAVPRTQMVHMLNYALSCNKTVLLLSDMYLPLHVMSPILKKCGIEGYSDLWISCEKHLSKQSGSMFKELATHFPNSKILHIGDNAYADVENPTKYGIDSFQILSGYEMLLHSSCRNLLSDVKSLTDSVVLGLWNTVVCNNPFALHKSCGKPEIVTMFQLGYLCFGPVLAAFMDYLIKKQMVMI